MAAQNKPRRKTVTSGPEMKVVLVGAVAVGKTSIVARYIKNTFSDYSDTTIGASYMAKDAEIDGNRIKFSIWDTAGQEQYHSLVPMYFRQSAAVILVYDVTKRKSFVEVQEWVEEIRKNAPPEVIIVLTGNKSDLVAERQVDIKDAEKLALDIGAEHVETSAKLSTGIFELFELLGRKFIAKRSSSFANSNAGHPPVTSVKLQQDAPKNENSCKC